MARRSNHWTIATTLAAWPIALLPCALSGMSKAETACPSGSLCDSFEEDAVGVAPGGPWTIESRGEPVIQVDDQGAYLGERSVKITARGRETAFITLKGAPLFPLAGNIMYGRSMMKLERAPEKRVHWTIIEGKGALADGGHVVEYRYGGSRPIEENGVYIGSRLMANYETPDGPKTDCWHTAKNHTVMPTGRWICLAWAFDGSENSMRLWLDGDLLDDLTVSGVGQGCMSGAEDFRWQASIFDQINLGWESYKEDEARTIWIDDVAISDQPLGCPVKTASETD